MSFFPAKLRASDLTYWHIERPEPEHHGWEHCHEYNFYGIASIFPRSKAEIIDLHLELRMRKGAALKVSSSMPLEIGVKIKPHEPIEKACSFQIRRTEEIIVPPHGYIVVKFNHGEAKRKVKIRFDDNFRPPCDGSGWTRYFTLHPH